jgi:hypothetical protein
MNEQVAKGFEDYLNDEDGSADKETLRLEESQDTQAEETEETEEQEEETEENSEQEEETEDASATEDGREENDEISTLAELAESFDVGESDLLEQIQVEGLEGEEAVSLATIIENYRNAPVAGEAAMEELEAERASLRETSDKHMSELIQMTARMARRVEKHREPEGGWDRLRAENANEYIRLREEQAEDVREANEAIALMDQEGSRREDAESKDYNRFVAEQAQKTFRLRPEWKEPKAAKIAHEEINGYLKSHGFDKDEIEGMVQANQIITVWKAAQYDKTQAAKPRVRKRLGKLPRKHLKPTARAETVRRSAGDKARKVVSDKFRKSGRIEDSLTLFGEHIE